MGSNCWRMYSSRRFHVCRKTGRSTRSTDSTNRSSRVANVSVIALLSAKMCRCRFRSHGAVSLFTLPGVDSTDTHSSHTRANTQISSSRVVDRRETAQRQPEALRSGELGVPGSSSRLGSEAVLPLANGRGILWVWFCNHLLSAGRYPWGRDLCDQRSAAPLSRIINDPTPTSSAGK